MTSTYIQPGEVLDYPATGAVTSGSPILIGLRLGVPLKSGVSGDVIPLQVWGVFALPKHAGDTPTQGALLYWDDTAKVITTTATSNTLAGYAAAAAASGDATVKIKINA